MIAELFEPRRCEVAIDPARQVYSANTDHASVNSTLDDHASQNSITALGARLVPEFDITYFLNPLSRPLDTLESLVFD